MLRSMLSIEHSKTMKQTMVKVELITMALIVGGLMVIMFAVSRFPLPENLQSGPLDEMIETVTWPGAFINALTMASGTGLGTIFVIVLAGALVAQEYQNKTLHLWLSRGVPRITYTLARFLSLMLPMLLLILSALAMGGMVSLFFSLIANGSLRLEQLNIGQLVLSILRTMYSLLPYAALAFLLAVVSRSAVVAIGVGLSFSLLVESLAIQLLMLFGGTVAQLAKFLPGVMVNVIMDENQAIINGGSVELMQNGSMMIPSLPLSGCIIGVALYTVTFVALAGWSLYKKDLTA